MEDYIVFAGNYSPQFKDEIESLTKANILSAPSLAGVISNHSEIKAFSREDIALEDILTNMEIDGKFDVLKIKVLNVDKLRDIVDDLCEKYKITYGIYEF